MKLIFLLPVLLLISCNDSKISKSPDSCDCEETIDNDSIFFASDVTIETNADQQILTFNCASVKNDVLTYKRPPALNDVKCTSAQNHELKLSPDYDYACNEMRYMEITADGAKLMFYDELKDNPENYYLFKVNKKRIVTSIYKLE
ncbi:hypothetical protein NAT51_13600 [Flavobacterium amniphilum]|uniref:hypothetical protein n=1 Tax=Flavobacterium amniphilum TaxID=1834035 RepID=UPI00202A79E8|nr:hypothetical protein [Flavobacterium amniphilum]MCL9806565.1 hypothetical protein [Flavobacterium amniphilum]